ncbi:MAG: histidine kinase [Angelakisella sp.]
MSFAENVSKAILENGMLVNFLDKQYQSRIDLEYYSATIYDYVKVSNGLSSDFRLRIYLKNESIPQGYSTFYHLRDISGIPAVHSFWNSQRSRQWIDGSELQHNKPAYHVLHTEDDYCFLQKVLLGDRQIGIILIQMPRRFLNNLSPSLGIVTEQAYDMISTGRTLVYNFTNTPIDDRKLEQLQNTQAKLDFDNQHIYSIYRFAQYPCDVVVATAHSPDRSVIQPLVFIFLLFFSIAIWLFMSYSKKMISDIHYCLDAMNQSIDQNFQTALHVERQDEISIIADRINYLLNRIRRLMHLNIEQQVAAKGTQLVALQHQINPHFLYNTMEVFSARMELAGLYQESAAMAAFCRMLRYNINSNSMLATIEEELLQVRNYIRIQEIREIPVTLEVNVPDEFRNAKIIKFVLQPLVENSFKYRDPEQPLFISISAQQEQQLITLRVQDNGIGLTTGQLERLNNRFRSPDHTVKHGSSEIGLFNINERLRLFYGEECGIHAAMQNGMTTFSLHIRNDISLLSADDLQPGAQPLP